ncbi:MAG TPA: hypothetical protein VLQ80_06880 [Candidatus Saccharimonadia bacterium]|nr:hypothetical protein [Candidatus Saccharimonadia bacterium]
MMHLNGLPADLAQFVDDALASGKYQSTEELVWDALHVLQEHAARQGAHRHPDETHADTPPQSPDDYLQALARALRTGEFGRARQLATAGAAPLS